jgi:hypothetical protein
MLLIVLGYAKKTLKYLIEIRSWPYLTYFKVLILLAYFKYVLLRRYFILLCKEVSKLEKFVEDMDEQLFTKYY